MSRDELLTKLAMEHAPDEWRDVATWTYDEHQFGWNEYQIRRTELINRPSWDDAPEWAEWLAQDYDGDWWWYECPIEVDDLDEEEWVEEHGVDGRLVRATSGAHPNGHDWRDTLEQRPDFDESRADAIGQNGNDGQHYEQKSWWTHKPCTLCERQATAKVSDDRPVCPECVVKYRSGDAGGTTEHDPLEAAIQDQMKWAAEKWARGDMEARSKYHREVKPGVWIDVYDVLQAWGVSNPALQHLIKKALAPGQRGHKDLMTDMDDIAASAKRARELES